MMVTMNRLQQVRTAEHSALSFPMRPLGHQQMATDTALGITERVIVDRGWFFLSLLYLDPNSKSPKPSPRASARSSLPSEALEEFLSILRPSLFSPRSPILHPLRYPISSLHDCALALPSKPVSGIDNLSVLPHDDSRTPVNQLGVPLNSRAPPLRENDENDVGPETPLRFFSSDPLGTSSVSVPTLATHKIDHSADLKHPLSPAYTLAIHFNVTLFMKHRLFRSISPAGSGPLSGLCRAASHTERARVNLTPSYQPTPRQRDIQYYDRNRPHSPHSTFKLLPYPAPLRRPEKRKTGHVDTIPHI